MEPHVTRLRARSVGLPLPGTPGPWNAITDVAGVEVGFTTVSQLSPPAGEPQVLTGVTAILPRGRHPRATPVWAGHCAFNGNGEMTGTHWIRDAGYLQGPVCITNTHSVGIVHHAAVGWMIDQYPADFRDTWGWAMPVVAETYDGIVNDICGRHVTEAHARAALDSARSGPVPEGNVGGGAGMQTYGFKGGTGTSSRRVTLAGREHTIGVLVQSNFGTRPDLTVLGVPVGQHLTGDDLFADLDRPETGSIIVVIATDAPLSPLQLQRVARRGALGIGRTGTSGGHYSGDIMLAFSTANPVERPPLGAHQPYGTDLTWLNDGHCDTVYGAVVQATEEAVLNALLAAETVPTRLPPGRRLVAIDPQALLDVLRAHGRLA